MRITKKLIVAGAGIVVLAAGGGAAYAATAADGAAEATAAVTAPKVTAERAIEIAHREVPGAWVREVGYDSRGSRPDVWEVELVKGTSEHEVDVDAATGQVVARERGDHHGRGDDDRHDGKHDGKDDRHGDDD
ncbi:PepSY domain-containing protein [Nonomuraea pusilla]|uniref:Peptidase propeptide and YPEB domain-containing protein n=1 Tax=Nonomuraea pusilla TaxID=46177 RepID=A0A1H7S7F0_9ACTN|nr:PepSY domain-containing protein [Nonomuraea pusilla]SEL68550.1 Peptidase propeptide and YPEB domain-containing protein [Nonomuraea pusilla]